RRASPGRGYGLERQPTCTASTSSITAFLRTVLLVRPAPPLGTQPVILRALLRRQDGPDLRTRRIDDCAQCGAVHVPERLGLQTTPLEHRLDALALLRCEVELVQHAPAAPRAGAAFLGVMGGGRRLPTGRQRSEEHTSELQSREKLVCRGLL